MQKKLLNLALLATFIIPQTGRWMAQAQVVESQQEPSAGVSSEKSFRALMNQPYYNDLFKRAQKRILKTDVDRRMEEFYAQDPELASSSSGFIQDLRENVYEETTKNLLTMMLITKDGNPRLYKVITRILLNHGASDKEVAGAKLFRKLADINAYAYSFETAHIGAVLQTGLDDIASLEEIEAVFQHELGHVRSGHVMMGAQDTVVQLRLAQRLLKIQPGQEADPTYQALRAKIIAANVDQYSRLLGKKGSTEFRAKGSNLFETAIRKLESRVIAKRFSNEIVDNPFDTIYLDKLIENFSEGEVDPSYIQRVEHFKAVLSPESSYSANADDVQEVFRISTLKISRAMETTADNWSIMVESKRAAMMDAQFGGQEVPKNPTREQIAQIISSIKKQVEMAIKRSTRAQWNDIMGGLESGDHPYSNLRVLRQSIFSQSLDRIGLDNRFLRHVVLLDQARLESAQAGLQNEKFTQMLAEAQASGNKRLAKSLTALIKKTTAQQVSAEQAQAAIEPIVQSLLADPTLAKKNPRLTNLLDYRLAQKQLLEQAIAAQQGAAGVGQEIDKATLAVARTAAKSLNQDSLVSFALAQLEKSSVDSRKQGQSSPNSQIGSEAIMSRVVVQTKLAFAANSTPADTLAARKVLSQLSQSRSRIGLDIQNIPKTSDVIPVRAQFKDDVANQRASNKAMNAMILEASRQVPLVGQSCRALFK